MNPQAQQQALPPFAASTRRNRALLPDNTVTSLGSFLSYETLSVGYLSRLWIQVYGTIVTSGTVAGAWSTYFPANLLASLAFRSNEGLEIYRTNGYSNLLVQMVMRRAFQPAGSVLAGANAAAAYPYAASAAATAGYSSQGAAGVSGSGILNQGGTGFSALAGATLTASQTYSVMCTYMIPIASDDRLTHGLLLLQNQTTKGKIEMQFNALIGNGGINGVGNASVTAGSITSISLTVRTLMEFFSVPSPGQGQQPNTAYVHRWIEEQVGWGAAGDVIYNVPVNGVVSRIIADVENNGTRQPWLTTVNQIGTQVGTNDQVTFAASQTTEITDLKIGLAIQRWEYGQDLPDGVFVNEFSTGGGSNELGWNGRDVYDTGSITQFQTKLNLNTTPTAGKIRFIRQELQRRSA